MNNNKKPLLMIEFSPALGLIFSVSAGALFGILFNQSIAIFAGAGAGLGLVLGAIIYAVFKSKK